jgi:RNA polymerase sigma-70 factor (ECF subfamily)
MTPHTLQKVSSASWDWAELRGFCFHQALRVVRCPVAADEAAQEAIIRAWRHSDTCRHPEQPFGWLGRIAHNEALRVVSRRPKEVLVDEPLAAAGEPGAPDRVGTALLIEGVLAALSPADQELARLRYYEDLTCATVADHLGISEATVKVRLHRLRRRLRQKLEEEI